MQTVKTNSNPEQASNKIDFYEDRVHRLGRITGIIALLLILSVPSLFCLYYEIFPPIKYLFAGIITVSMIYIPVSIGEVLVYSPMLGSGGTYLAFVTGNLINLKVPCATVCMDLAGVKPATREGDIITTIAVACSSLVTTFILLAGVITIVPLTPLLRTPALEPAFANILPALFGAFGAYWIIKQWKLAVAPLSLAVTLSLFIAIPIGALIPLLALVSVGAARAMYRKKWITGSA